MRRGLAPLILVAAIVVAGLAVAGFFVGGKTGTAEKVVHGRYSKTKNLNTFTAVYPMDKPKYVFLTIIDEPQAVEGTHGFMTSGWNAAPSRT